MRILGLEWIHRQHKMLATNTRVFYAVKRANRNLKK